MSNIITLLIVLVVLVVVGVGISNFMSNNMSSTFDSAKYGGGKKHKKHMKHKKSIIFCTPTKLNFVLALFFVYIVYSFL